LQNKELTRQRNQEEKRKIEVEKNLRDVDKENEYSGRQVKERKKENEYNRFQNTKSLDKLEDLRGELKALESH